MKKFYTYILIIIGPLALGLMYGSVYEATIYITEWSQEVRQRVVVASAIITGLGILSKIIYDMITPINNF